MKIFFIIIITNEKISETSSLNVLTRVTWKKLYKNLLQELNQQASGFLFIFSKLESFHNVLHLCIHLEEKMEEEI